MKPAHPVQGYAICIEQLKAVHGKTHPAETGKKA